MRTSVLYFVDGAKPNRQQGVTVSDDERFAAIEMRLGSLERMLERLLQERGRDVPKDEIIDSEKREIDVVKKDEKITNQLDNREKWYYDQEKNIYEYLVNTKRCPVKGGDLHRICRNGSVVVKYKDVGREVRVRVRRYLCKNCKNSFLQALPDMHNHHKITMMLRDAIRASVGAVIDKNNKMPRGSLKRISEEHGVDQKVVTSVVSRSE